MRGPRAARAALFVVFAAGCGQGDARPAPPAGAPSVLLVSIDTLRADRVGAYGARYGATPRLDALAAEGARAETAIAPAPITLPSHATLFTGLYPPRHGVRHNGIFRLAEERTTLAERFADAGYATAAVVGAFVLEARFGLAQGFDHYDDDFGADRASATGYPERRASAVTDAALRWLAAVDRPFFLFVHYYDPHADYAPPPPFAERFAGRPYEGEVAYVDAELGRLLDGVRARGQLEGTVVAVTADHGESLGEHGERTHSYTLYDATLAVPLVLEGPGVPRGATLPGVVSTASVAPTLLRLAGLAPLAEADGEDLLARLASGSNDEGRAGSGAYAESLATELDHGWAPLHALRTPSLHYVRAPRPELYAVEADPGQRANLLAAGPRPEAAALDAEVARVLEGEVALRTATPDAQTLARLRALGYALPEAPVARTGIDPKDGLPRVELYVEGRAAYFAGDLATAERKARALLEASPASGQAAMLLSDVEKRRGRRREALALAERAAELLPRSAAFHAAVGDLRAELGDLAGAISAYEAALAVDADFAEAHAGLMLRARLGAPEAEVEAHAARALALLPEDPLLRLRVAEGWDRLGDAGRALAEYREALRLDPGSEAAQMGLAIQLVRLGREAEAERHLDAAGRYAEEPNHRNRLAIAYAGRGRADRAEALFRELLAAHPEHANARRNLAHLLRTTGRAAEAEAVERESEGSSARGG
jgi:arylsulfatase A-like enzyme